MKKFVLVVASLLVLSSPAQSKTKRKHRNDNFGLYSSSIVGYASYYWQPQMTASGERFNKNSLTAAHRTYPMGTRVLVTNVSNGNSVVVRINDRGPYVRGRIIDLSKAAAQQIGMIRSGVAKVRLERF